MPRRKTTFSESGAALAVALFALAVISLVGLVLLGVVRESTVRTASTEASVRAELLAQSGLDRILSQIRKIADDVASSGLSYRDAVQLAGARLDDINSLFDGAEYTVQGGKYRLEVLENRETSSPAGLPVTDPDVPYVRKIVVRSTGSFDRRPPVSVKKTMTVYVGTIHPVFRYPVSARGDLSLNGSPYIVGDVLVRDGNLLVANEARVVGEADSSYGFVSDWPAIRGFLRVDGRPGGGDRFWKTATTGPYAHTTSSSPDFDIGYFSSRMFPFEDPTLEPDPDLDPAAYVDRKSTIFAARAVQPFDNVVPEGEFEHVIDVDRSEPGSVRFSKTSVVVDGSLLTIGSAGAQADADLLIEEGSLRLQPGSSGRRPELRLQNGSLFVKLSAPQQIAADLSGTLTLQPDRFAYIEGDVLFNDGFALSDGSMYIQGNLTVVGDIRLRGTVYVDGDVDLKGMRSINGQSGGAQIPLVLIASGDIVLGDSTNEHNADAEIRAFLFSKRQLRMYGVVSKLFLSGGIHGENPGGTAVELHAVRGELQTSGGEPPIPYAGPAWPGPNIEPDQEVLPPETSRLQIYHDAQLYERPPTGIPITESLNIFVAKVERG